jgi:hypothetical protein
MDRSSYSNSGKMMTGAYYTRAAIQPPPSKDLYEQVDPRRRNEEPRLLTVAERERLKLFIEPDEDGHHKIGYSDK